jgi:hypothetical protein
MVLNASVNCLSAMFPTLNKILLALSSLWYVDAVNKPLTPYHAPLILAHTMGGKLLAVEGNRESSHVAALGRSPTLPSHPRVHHHPASPS